MRLLAILISIVASCIGVQAGEQQPVNNAIACPHTDGLIDGPYVADEATARAIALAIIERRQSRERQAEYDLNVKDDGSFWTVYQSVRGYPKIDGDKITVMAGGGGLTMRIEKCDGSISSVHGLR